jgi:hypothetical protein
VIVILLSPTIGVNDLPARPTVLDEENRVRDLACSACGQRLHGDHVDEHRLSSAL